nr:hypothetical protein [Tanacetum cinerariifolium]
MRFGTISFGLNTSGDLKFRNSVFLHKVGLIVTSLDDIGVIEDEEMFGKLCDEDSIRLCLLLALEVTFMGRLLTCPMDDTLFGLVENLEAWNVFPRGSIPSRAEYESSWWIHSNDFFQQRVPKPLVIEHHTLFQAYLSKLEKSCKRLAMYHFKRCRFLFPLMKQYKGESIHDYYVWFAKLINDMRSINMTMSRIQLNSKFVNNMLPEWGRIVTASGGSECQGRQNRGKGMNPRGESAVGYGGAQNRVGNVNPGQARPVKCYNCNSTGHIAMNCTQPKRPQNSEYYKDKMLLMQAQENGVALDAEQLLFLAGRQDNAFDDDVDEQPVQDLALNVDNVFQTDDCDAFDSTVDEAPTAQTLFMANLSSADPVTDEAGPSYDSNILSEIHDHDHYQDAAYAHHEEHVMHDIVQFDHVVDSHADYTSNSNMILDNHAPAIVHNTKDTLEIAEINRNKMNAKINDPECVTRKVKIAPHDHSKENFLATFTPQKQLTLEQIFWSNDLIKLKSKALKEQTTVSRSIKALIVYPPNTPAMLVPKVLPTKKVFSEAKNFELNVARFIEMHVANTIVEARCLALEAELANLPDKSHHNNQEELINNFSKLEVTALTTKNVNLKAQTLEKVNSVSKDQVKPTVLARRKHAIDVEPIVPRIRNNRDAHLDYLRHLKESVKTIRDIVEEAKVVRPLDRSIVSACRYTKNSQELLEYAIGTCPQGSQQRAKQLAHIPLIMKKQVTFAKPSDKSNSTTHQHVVTVKPQQTNVPVPPSTRVNSCPNASGSRPKSNVKPNRISPAKDQVWKPKQVRQVWKSTGKVLTTIGHQWRPTCQILNLGKQFPLTRFTPSKVVSAKQNKKRASYSKHMKGNRSRLMNFMKNFIGIVRFRNDHFVAIMGYGDYMIGDSVISRLYYVEGLGHNLFSVRQFCDSDLEVAFRKHSSYVRDTDGVELIKGSRGLQEKSWLWHWRLNHLNFGTINDLARKDLVRGLPRLKFEKDHLCSAYQLGKSKKHTHKPKTKNTNLEVLNTLYMDLRGPMRVQTINGKKYILVIIDDYSRFTWVKILRSKDETPEIIIKFIQQIQVSLNKTVRYVRTDNGTEFVNHTLTEYYARISIFYQKTVPRTPQQNGVVERRNRTLVEAAWIMLIFSKARMFLWVEVVATACYTQNRSLIHTRHHKTPYELVHNKKPDLTFFIVFGALCYPTNVSEDLGKLQLTADIGIFVGYAPSRKGYRIYNKRTRRIMETIHVQFDELTEQMASVHLGTGPAPNLLTPGQISSGLVPNPIPATPYTPPTNKELEILFQPMFDEYLKPPRVERPVLPAQAVQAPVNSAERLKADSTVRVNQIVTIFLIKSSIHIPGPKFDIQ